MAPSPCQPVTSSPWQVGKPATTTDCKCLGANVNGMRWCHGTESLRHVNVPDFTFEMDGKMPNFFNDKPAELHRNVLATERDEKEIDKTLAADRLDRLSAIGVPVSPGRQLSPLHKNHGITSEIEDNGEPPIWDNYQVRNPGAEDDASASSDASSVCSTGELPPLDNIVNIDADLGFEVDPGAALTRTTNGFKQQGDADGDDESDSDDDSEELNTSLAISPVQAPPARTPAHARAALDEDMHRLGVLKIAMDEGLITETMFTSATTSFAKTHCSFGPGPDAASNLLPVA